MIVTETLPLNAFIAFLYVSVSIVSLWVLKKAYKPLVRFEKTERKRRLDNKEKEK